MLTVLESLKCSGPQNSEHTKVGLCAQVLKVLYQIPSSQHLDISSGAASGGSQILAGPLSRELPRRKMKSSVDQRPGPGPCWECSVLPSHLSADTDAWTFFFFLLCFVVFYFVFRDSNSFCKAKRKKALRRIQVFISAEGISTAFVKLSWSVKRLCFWLTVAKSKSIN